MLHLLVTAKADLSALLLRAHGSAGGYLLHRIILVLALIAVGQDAVAQSQKAATICGWIGAQVAPMTKPFADSLGMAVPYGAIFGAPEPGGPAAKAGIEAGDVVTAINGSPLMDSHDFAPTIAEMAPDSDVHLSTSRNGEQMEIRVTLGSAKCAQRPVPSKQGGEVL
jgi:S1-C subfamily serine protease